MAYEKADASIAGEGIPKELPTLQIEVIRRLVERKQPRIEGKGDGELMAPWALKRAGLFLRPWWPIA